MKIIKRILIAVLGLVVAAAAGFFAVLAFTGYKNEHYYKFARPAGEIEKKYTALGPCEVSHAELDADGGSYGQYQVWYPAEMTDSRETYPLVVMANGTGIKASQYGEVFGHLASWGFIVAGNGDENSRTGASSAATLELMLSLNEDESSEFYGRIDTDNIGIAGHSQGGVGAINAVAAQENGHMYKAIFTASATSPYWGQDDVFGPEWSYDMGKVGVPCFMVAGTGGIDAGTAADISAREGQGICPLWGMSECYDAIPDSVGKVMARAVGKDHGDMLRGADGYMTAWFMYWLQGDREAAGAFLGADAEILTNELYQDQRSNLR